MHLVRLDLPGGPASIGPAPRGAGRAAEEAGIDGLSLMDPVAQYAEACHVFAGRGAGPEHARAVAFVRSLGERVVPRLALL